MLTIDQLQPVSLDEQQIRPEAALAFGMGGHIIRVPNDPGFCYKMPDTSFPVFALQELSRQVETHAVLTAFNIPTLPVFEVRAANFTQDGHSLQMPCIRMTDLAADGALVISEPDIYHMASASSMEPGDIYHQLQGRPAYNGKAFFTQLLNIISNAASASGQVAGINVRQIRINGGGYFLIAHPDGTLETRVGDLHDGVEIYKKDEDGTSNPEVDSQEAIRAFNAPRVGAYVQMATYIFPELQPYADKFMAEDFLNFQDQQA